MNVEPLLAGQVMARLALMLVHSLWQGVAIAFVLAIFLRCVRDERAPLRYAASCVAMASLLIAMAVTFAMLGDQAVQFANEGPAPARIEPSPIRVSSDTELDSQNVSAIDYGSLASRWGVIVWLGGVTLLSTRNVVGWLRLKQFVRRRAIRAEGDWTSRLAALAKRMGVRRTVELRSTAGAAVPFMFGLFKPLIIMPLAILNELTPAQVEAILAHELAHVRRHDYLVNLLQCAAETLLFYHPACWWISRQIRTEREHCCDDVAAEISRDRRGYAEALVRMEEGRHGMADVAIGALGAPLAARIRRLVAADRRPPGRFTSKNVLPASVLASLIVVGTSIAVILDGGAQSHAQDARSLATGPSTAPAEQDELNEKYDAQAQQSVATAEAMGRLRVAETRLRVRRAALARLKAAVERGDVNAKEADDAEIAVAECEEDLRIAAAIAQREEVKEWNHFGLGEYNLEGEVRHPGLYSMSNRGITLKQALLAAGIDTTRHDTVISITRYMASGMPQVLSVTPIDAVFDRSTRAIVISAGDYIRVTEVKSDGNATKPASPASQAAGKKHG